MYRMSFTSATRHISGKSPKGVVNMMALDRKSWICYILRSWSGGYDGRCSVGGVCMEGISRCTHGYKSISNCYVHSFYCRAESYCLRKSMKITLYMYLHFRTFLFIVIDQVIGRHIFSDSDPYVTNPGII